MDRDTLIAYALGILSEAEAREVERFLRDHPEARREVDADEESLAQLVLALDPAPLPEGGEERLLQSVRQNAQTQGVRLQPLESVQSLPAAPRRRRFLGPVFGLAAVLAALLVLGAPALREWQAERQLDAYRAQPGAVTRTLQDAGGASLGTIVRLTDGRTFVLLREPPASGRVYQAWRVESGGPVSLGVFGGRSFLSAPLPAGTTFALSVEPPGGSPAPTTTPITAVKL